MDTHKEFPKTITKTIPDELIYDNILPRLPVKSLIRFKTVSKSWNSLISTPQFTKSHLHFSLSSPQFLLKSNNSFYTLSYTHHNTLTHLLKLDLPVSWNLHQLIFVGCCNGLICLCVVDNIIFSTYFVVFNPLTFQLRKINTPFADFYSPFFSRLGFGYVPTLDDYKIFLSDVTENGLWVLSLRAPRWKYIRFPSDYPFNEPPNRNPFIQIYLDGTFYWVVSFGDEKYIYGFSLVDEQFELESPLVIPPTMITHGYISRLCVFKGSLSIMCDRTDKSDVFVIKREGESTSWEKLFSIHDYVSDVMYVGFAITGKCLVLRERYIGEDEGELAERKLKLVDPTLEDVEFSQGIDFEHEDVHSVHYVESLVSPFTLT